MKKIICHAQEGAALIMVLTAITLLTTLLVQFTFDLRVNKFKVQSSQDKVQAKLNAESGLRFALVRLKLYQEAFNLVQKNTNLKDVVTSEILNQLWSIPFVYPLPLPAELNIIQKAAVEEFSKNMLLKGGFQISIQNISHRLNLNLLRQMKLDLSNVKNENQEEKGEEDDPDKKITLVQEFSNMLKTTLQKMKEKDEEFNDKYSSVNPDELFANIQYFVSDQNSYDDPLRSYAENQFQLANRSPKFAPLSSLSELSLIPGWNQELIDLIENDFTAHGASLIDMNRMTDHILQMLFPTLDETQRKEFFNYRDNPDAPQNFKTQEDLKTYLTQTTKYLSEETFDERVEQWKKAGLSLSGTAFLFKVIVTASYKKGLYNLTAYVSLPTKISTQKGKKEKKKTDSNTQDSGTDNPNPNQSNDQPEAKKKTEETSTLELQDPRVVELIVE